MGKRLRSSWVFSPNPDFVLKRALFDTGKPWVLKPKKATFFIDKKYVLYRAGILAEEIPGTTLRIMKRYLKKVIFNKKNYF